MQMQALLCSNETEADREVKWVLSEKNTADRSGSQNQDAVPPCRRRPGARRLLLSKSSRNATLEDETCAPQGTRETRKCNVGGTQLFQTQTSPDTSVFRALRLW